MAAGAVFAGLTGLILGSFLNVVIHRLPRKESLVAPGSHCPRCGAPVKPYDNVPVVSWLLLRRRCRNCREPISARYPLVEAATGLLCAGVVLTDGSAVQIALGEVLALTLIPLALIDLDHHILPNVIVGPAAVAALAIGTALDASGEPERLIAGASAGAFFLLFHLASPKGMGMGDVKVAGMLGLFLGGAVAPAVAIALVTGILYGAVNMARTGDRGLPFGPWLVVGGLVGVYAGDALVSAYLDNFA